MKRCGAAAIAAAFALAALPPLPCVARADEQPHSRSRDVVEEDEPVFPLMREAVRMWFESEFIPEAGLDAGDADISLIKPGLRGRNRVPVGRRASTQLSGGFSSSRYDIDGEAGPFDECTTCPEPDEFYAVSLALQGALLLNTERHLLFEGERWGLLGGGFGRARWESGAFEDSLTAGGEVGLGYELPDRLRFAVGVRVETALDGGKPSISPTGTFRWDITEDVRLRNRGLGAQLEWRQRRFEVFITGYRASDRFLFHSRSGAPNDVLFKDSQWLTGAGVEWKLFRRLRVVAEAGAVVSRELSLRAHGEGTLAEVTGDPSPYATVRLEIRP
jgi:hypothetical protein